MPLGGGYRRRGPAVQIAFQIANHPLPRRVVAEGDVDVTVDQPGNCRAACGVDHHVAARGLRGGKGADRGDATILHQDAVSLGKRRFEVAGDDGAEIDDGSPHGVAPQLVV